VTDTTATPKEQFDVLLSLLKDAHKDSVDFEFKHGTFLALIAGWFITSENARTFLSQRIIVVVVLCILLITLTCLHGVWVWQFKVRSDDAFHRIGQLGFIQQEMLARHTVTNITYRSFILVHSTVTMGICALILNVTLTGP
jgi:hypothetical protein